MYTNNTIYIHAYRQHSNLRTGQVAGIATWRGKRINASSHEPLPVIMLRIASPKVLKSLFSMKKVCKRETRSHEAIARLDIHSFLPSFRNAHGKTRNTGNDHFAEISI
jgi:hypothetical protein